MIRSLLAVAPLVFILPQQASPAAQKRDDAKSAAKGGDPARAHRLLLQSLELEPANPEALRELVKVSETVEARGDAAALWRHALAGALADENGNIKYDEESKSLLKNESLYKPITVARAELAREIGRVAERAGAARTLTRWLNDLCAELWRKQPSLEKKYSALLANDIHKTDPNEMQIVAALSNALDRAMAASKFEEAARLALVLRGLASQAGYKDSMTPAPSMKSAGAEAAAALARAREMLKSREGELPTIDSLEKLNVKEREEFTINHRNTARPGVVMSPGGLYRVETVCGLDTLVSTAKQVEYHHRRIVKWIGGDPFAGRVGTVRIVPRATDLDAEGSPFWWAGGFQGGDLTTLHFAHGTPGQLGHGLTHELTHRFDGAMYPGMAGWLAEGRAVWTGGAYGNITDDLFIESYASFGAIAETYRRGRGTVEYLTKLLTGTMADYRENYTAGHSLWVYLWSWSPDNKIFRPQLQKYLTGLKTQQKAVDWFVQCFADGKGGRPSGLEGFSKVYSEFIKGFWWESYAPFTKFYTGGVAATEADNLIYDSPTWHGDRVVAERYFGAAHSTDAARWFMDNNDYKDAIAAYEWAFSRDEPSANDAMQLALAYEKNGKFDSAYAVRARARHMFPYAFARTKPPAPPSLQLLSSLDARVNNLLKEIAAAADAEGAAGRPDAAAALASDYNIIASIASKPRLAIHEFNDPASRPAKLMHPMCDPPVSLAIHGGAEERLIGYDDYRSPGLWAISPGGDVILGRKEFAAQTGLQHEAWLVETFMHGRDYISGQYTISARVRFLTSDAQGAMIIGYQRHDRCFSVGFKFQDTSDIANHDDQKGGGDSTWLERIGDMRDREPALMNGKIDARVSVTKGNPSFLLEVDVDGAAAHIFANGKYITTHTAASGVPIEGFVGFASLNGVILLEHPTYQFHRPAVASGRCGCKVWPDGIDLESKRTSDWEHLVGQRATGFEIGARGTAILWNPNLKGVNTIAEDPSIDLPIDAAKHFMKLRAEAALDELPLIVALPETLTNEEEARAREKLQPLLLPRDKIIVHKGHAGYDAWRAARLDPAAFYDPFLLFIDSNGYIRAQQRYRMDNTLPIYFVQWARLCLGGY